MTTVDEGIPRVAAAAGLAMDGPAGADGFGPYVVRSPLPSSGLGARYRAERARPVCRSVTLQVVGGSLDARAAVARFEAERPRLSALDDARLAPVRDAGVSGRGLAYFVSAPPEGTPLTSHCDRHGLGVADRLLLFAEACDAVLRAHQAGVVHGRIAPATVLASAGGEGPPVLLAETGLASILASRPDGAAVVAEESARAGLASGLAPELLRPAGAVPDTRSDVFALGSLLYELMTGGPPHPDLVPGTGLARVRRVVAQRELTAPSVRVRELADAEEVAAARGTDAAGLGATLRGGIDDVVRRCLEKDPDARYDSVLELAAAARQLADPGRSRRAAARGGPGPARGRLAIAAGLVVVLAVAAGALPMIGTLLDALGVRAPAPVPAEPRAPVEPPASRPSGVADFLVGELLVPAYARTPDLPGAALDRASARIDEAFAGDPLAQADARCALGAASLAYGRAADARAQLARCAALRRESLGADHPLTLAAMRDAAAAGRASGDEDDDAALLSREVRAWRRQGRLADARARAALSELGTLHEAAGRPLLAASAYALLAGARESELGPDHPDTIEAASDAGAALVEGGRPDEALPWLRKASERAALGLAPGEPRRAAAAVSLGTCLVALGRYDEAEDELVRAFRDAANARGRSDPGAVAAARELARMYDLWGRRERRDAWRRLLPREDDSR